MSDIKEFVMNTPLFGNHDHQHGVKGFEWDKVEFDQENKILNPELVYLRDPSYSQRQFSEPLRYIDQVLDMRRMFFVASRFWSVLKASYAPKDRKNCLHIIFLSFIDGNCRTILLVRRQLGFYS